MGRIEAVCISEKKGTAKHDVGRCTLIADFGIEGDAHAGSERQVSLLSYEKVEEFNHKIDGKVHLFPGCFGENLLVSGFDLTGLVFTDVYYDVSDCRSGNSYISIKN